jgi:hypothetical protein
MQYKVPQYIDQEDKILGPLTFLQFVYVLIGGTLILLCFTLLDFVLFLFFAIPIAIFTILFSLVKIQDQPFSRFFMAFLAYLRLPKRRLWQDLTKEQEQRAASLLARTKEAKTVKMLKANKAEPQAAKAAPALTPSQLSPVSKAAASASQRLQPDSNFWADPKSKAKKSNNATIASTESSIRPNAALAPTTKPARRLTIQIETIQTNQQGGAR